MINNGSESRKELLDTVLDYSFDQEKVELEILVDMHEWVLTRREPLSLGSNK